MRGCEWRARTFRGGCSVWVEADFRCGCRHRVVGWSISRDVKTEEIVYLIKFQRLPSEPGMETVLCRPWSDEVEDYLEYKRIRREQRAHAGVDGTVESGSEGGERTPRGGGGGGE